MLIVCSTATLSLTTDDLESAIVTCQHPHRLPANVVLHFGSIVSTCNTTTTIITTSNQPLIILWSMYLDHSITLFTSFLLTAQRGTATGEAASSHLFSPRFYLLISFHQQFPFTCPLLSTVLRPRMFKLSSRFPPSIQSVGSHLLCSFLSSSPDQNLRLAATPIGTALFAKREPP